MRAFKEALEKPPDAEAKCPICGNPCIKPYNLIKEWCCTPKAKPGEIVVWIHYWQCWTPGCEHRFRTATRLWPQKHYSQEAKRAGKTKVENIRKKLLQRQMEGTTR